MCVCAFLQIELLSHRIQQMSTFEGITTAQQAEARWNDAIQKIDVCFQNCLKNTKAINQMADSSSFTQLADLLYIALITPDKNIKFQTQQKAASLMASLLDVQSTKIGFAVATRYYFQILFNFKIPCTFKAFFFRHIAESLKTWRTQLDSFYQRAISLTISMAQNLSHNHDGSHQTTITMREQFAMQTMGGPFILSFDWPDDKIQVFSTIILIAKILLQVLQDCEEDYCLWLAQLMRKVNSLVICEQFLKEHPKLIEQLLTFWSDLADQAIGNDIQKKKEKSKSGKVLQTWIVITGWQDFYDSLNRIMQYMAPRGYRQEYGQVFDFFHLERHWQVQVFYKIKQIAAKICSEMLFAGQVVGGQDMYKFVAGQAERLRGSLLHSLEGMVGNIHTFDSHQLDTCQDFIDLAVAVLAMIPAMTQQRVIHVAGQILVPLLEFFLAQTLPIYKEDTMEFLKLMQDCCEGQKQSTLLAKTAKLFETLCDSYQVALDFILDYSKHSLVANSQSHEGVMDGRPPMSRTSALLAITILTYNTQRMAKVAQDLQLVFIPQFLGSLSEVEVALLYLHFIYTIEEFYDNSGIIPHILLSTVVSDMTFELRIFAMNLLLHTSPKWFNQNLVQHFLKVFRTMGRNEFKWPILEKVLQKQIHLFQPDMLIDLVEETRQFLPGQMVRIKEAMGNRSLHNSQELLNNLRLCLQIAREHQCCIRYPALQQSLWGVVLCVEQVQQLYHDDILIRVGVELLEPVKYLPVGFETVLTLIKETFERNQYTGTFYYDFLQKAGHRCGQGYEDCLKIVGEILATAASYFVFYPEDMTVELYVSLNNSILVMQNLIIYQRDRLANDFILDAVDLVNQLPQQKTEIKDFPVLQCRLVNLKLALLYVTKIQIDFQEILDLANRQIFASYDSGLLLYLLEQFIDRITEEKKQFILTVVVYLLRGEESRSKRKQASSEQVRRFNSLLSYIDPAVPLELNLKLQARTLMQKFIATDFRGYQIALNRISQSDLAELSRLLNSQLKPRQLLRVVGGKKEGIEMKEGEVEIEVKGKRALEEDIEEEFSDSDEERSCRRGVRLQKRVRLEREVKSEIVRQKGMRKR